ncbi:hypothetical protein AB833_28205 [Chromatiales bacterium (ex Bugula neritina AB1)]|nr:hypothetical protein AB833_28205 [Chromatiales bacterium (ex Bugula neritina AB1)]
MTSVVDLAKLSDGVYTDQPKIGQWLRVGIPFQVKGSGFKSALYQHMESNEYVLAIAGTELSDSDDLKSDVQIAMGNVPNQHRVARSAYHSVGAVVGDFASVYVTGHSLGGGLASMLGKEHGEPCVTFNAPGMARSFAKLEALEPGVSAVKDEDRKVLHIRAVFDVVSVGTGRHLGAKGSVKSVYTAPLGKKEVAAGMAASMVMGPFGGSAVTSGMVSLKAHGITRLIPVLERKPDYTKDLAWV